MRFLRRLAGILGFARDDGHDVRDCEDEVVNSASDSVSNSQNQPVDHKPRGFQETGLPRKGFSVPVKVAVERPQSGPVIVHCASGGGVQGLRWYAKRLKIDEDGDVADEFLNEAVPETSEPNEEDEQKPLPKFQIKHSTRHAKVKNQAISRDGKLEQSVEFQGRLQWV